MRFWKWLKIKLWVLVDVNVTDHPLTICFSRKNAREYADKVLREEYDNEYSVWAIMNGLNIDSYFTWEAFKNDQIAVSELERFNICRLTYSVADLVSIFRLALKCVPRGCSFESPDELAAYNEKEDTEDVKQ